MFPTFSVNKNSYSDRVSKLLEQLEQGKKFSPEFLSDIYIKAVDGEEINDISAYSKQMEKLALLARSKSRDIPILSEDEITFYKGISESNLPYTYDDIEHLASQCSLVQQFLDIRENLYYVLGVDIYRLLALIEDNDFVAKQKLDAIVAEFPDLKDFFYELLTTPNILQSIHEILA